MLIRLPEIEITPENPYSKDRLGRLSFGSALLNLLKNAEGEFTLAIDGQWGDGKTTFAKMWCEQLKLEGFRAIYFDSFVNDHGQDPFVPLSAVLLDAIRPETETTNKKTKEKFAKMGLKLLQIGSRVALRSVSAGIINENDIQDFRDTLQDHGADTAITAIEKKLDEYHTSESELNSFRTLLSELAQLEGAELPLVIILDELDRCRPTFALSLLEKVKHFFCVQGIVFVFVMNSKQMCACIEHVYGASIGARQYLHKFIDVECALPVKRKIDRQESLYRTYTRHLLSAYALDKRLEYEKIKESFFGLAEAFDLSLRDMEKACRSVALYCTTLEMEHIPITELVCFLAVLKVRDQKYI